MEGRGKGQRGWLGEEQEEAKVGAGAGSKHCYRKPRHGRLTGVRWNRRRYKETRGRGEDRRCRDYRCKK